MITEHFGGILACGERSQAAQLLTHCLITRPHQEKPPNLNWEQSIWFTTEHILMFKYRREQRPKMTRSILSQQRLKTTPLLLSSEFCVVWHCGPSVNKMWSNGNLSPANPCLPDYVMRASWTYSHFLTRKAVFQCKTSSSLFLTSMLANWKKHWHAAKITVHYSYSYVLLSQVKLYSYVALILRAQNILFKVASHIFYPLS